MCGGARTLGAEDYGAACFISRRPCEVVMRCAYRLHVRAQSPLTCIPHAGRLGQQRLDHPLGVTHLSVLACVMRLDHAAILSMPYG